MKKILWIHATDDGGGLQPAEGDGFGPEFFPIDTDMDAIVQQRNETFESACRGDEENEVVVDYCEVEVHDDLILTIRGGARYFTQDVIDAFPRRT